MTTPVCLAYLADHVDWLAHRPEAEEAFEELHAAVAALYAAVDTSPAAVYAGPCEVCGRDMYAREGAEWVECRPCGVRHAVTERRDWLLAHVVDQLATATEISRALANWGTMVTPERIRQWAQPDRGRLLVRGRDLRGRPLYRVGDVIDAANHPKRSAS